MNRALYACLAMSAAALVLAQPNIVLIVSDDAGYGDFGFTGSRQIETPNLDRLAREGVVFEQGYVCAPVCSPSRAGLITGRYPQRFGYEHNLPPGKQPGVDPSTRGLSLEEKTIADRLKEQGYVTGAFGKWHLGYEDHFYPTRRGFDEFYGFRGGSRTYWEEETPYSPMESNVTDFLTVSYLTDDLGREAAEFVNRHAGSPFFLYLAFNAPHTPMHAPEDLLARFGHLSNQRRRIYAAMMWSMDRAVGTVLERLDALGISQETLIVFLNDNGGAYEYNQSLNAPFNGKKGTYLEGGIRVPFVVWWPEQIDSGRYEHPVVSLDILPTVLAAAGKGVEPEWEIDGTNLLPHIAAGTSIDRPLYWRLGKHAAIREGNWKLIRLPDRLPLLYDVANDPSERVDIADKHPARVRELLRKLWSWESELQVPLFHTGTYWMVENVKLYDRLYRLTQPERDERVNLRNEPKPDL